MANLEIKVGHVYRAKKPRQAGFGEVNDRQVIWVDSMGLECQYDGPAVARGARYPRTSVAAFLNWAGEDVTDSLPRGEWCTYADYLKLKAEP